MFEQRRSSFDYQKNKEKHDFGWKISRKEVLTLVFGLPGEQKYKNSQMNCISQLLTALFILSTLSLTSICQLYALKVDLFLDMTRFLHTHPLLSLFLQDLHLCRLRQLEKMQSFLLKAM